MKATLTSPIASTYVGVFTRGQGQYAARDHYAAFVNPSGIIKLRRRNNWVYTSDLATGPAFPSGTHVIGVSTAGTNPVQITVTLDGSKVIEYSDSSSSRWASGNKVGIFDYNGAQQPIDDFVVVDGPDGSDNFDTGTSLGSDWTIASGGSFSVASSRAHSTAAQSYAFIGPDMLNATAAVELDSSWLMQTFSGVVLRDANAGALHYAGGVDASGNVQISKKNGTYTTLATGSAFPSGVHVLSLTATGTGPVQLSLKIDGAEWLHYDDASGAITDAGRAGMFSSEATYGNGQYFGRFDVFGDIVLTAVPPELAEIPSVSAFVGQRLLMFLGGTDRNGGTLTFSGSNLPTGARVDTINVTGPWGRVWNVGVFNWTPTAAQVGTVTPAPTITVTDNTEQTDSQAVTINVFSCSPISHFMNANPVPTPGRTYYVNGSTGSDSNDGLTSATAVEKISTALARTKTFCSSDGDPECETGVRVLIEKVSDTFVYDEEAVSVTDLTGTASAPIWISGEGTGKEPTLADFRGDGGGHEVLKLRKPKYVVLEYLTIGRTTGVPPGSTLFTRSNGVNIDDGEDFNNYEAAHHVIIRNVRFRNIGDPNFLFFEDGEYWANQNCIKPSGLNWFYFLDNTFEGGCGRGMDEVKDVDGDGQVDDQVIRGGNGINADGCHDGWIAGNEFTGRTFLLSKGGSRNIEIRQNRTTHHLDEGDDKRLTLRLGGAMQTTQFRPQLDSSGDADGFHYEARHIRLLGNVLEGGTGIRFEGCYQCLVANNTIVDVKNDFIHATQAILSRQAIFDTGEAHRKFVSEGRIYNNIFFFNEDTEDAVKKGRASTDATFFKPEMWATFKFNSNLYCNQKNRMTTCGPNAKEVDSGPTITEQRQGTDCTGYATCDPQFTDLSDYAIPSSSPAKYYEGALLTSGAPSVLTTSGSSATSVEDVVNVCYSSTEPARGAREVP